ncbi:MAG: integrase arm-type DNA-binding domain-containing protein [Sphingomonadales bacterium]|nr:integrase arm-type DNA-binding domain-containing protein [Sphingomonadales bacterium]
MASGRITKRSVDALQAAARDAFLWDADCKGFGCKITPADRRIYVFQYRPKGQSVRRVTLGPHGELTPSEARARAEHLRAAVLAGHDPVAIQRAARTARKAELEAAVKAELVARDHRVSVLLDQWLDASKKSGADRSASTRAFYKTTMRAHILPIIRDLPVGEITPAHWAQIKARIPASQRAARRSAFATLSAFVRWAAEEGLADDVLANVKRQPPVPARARVLSDEELARVWRAADALPAPFMALYRLGIVTGQRRSEIAGMMWQELDRKAKVWTIPAARTKNGLEHIVSLSPLAVAEIDRLIDGKGSAEWPRKGPVLTTNGCRPVSGFSSAKRRIDVSIAEDGAAPFTLPWRFHDLRRTLATGLQKLSVRLEVTEAVLNHRSGARSGIVGVYQTHDYAEERREALDAWGAKVAALVAPTDIIDLAAERKARRAESGRTAS